MVMSIQNNFAASTVQRNLQTANVDMGKSVEKLSSGLRVNVAADGPADLVESEKLRAQIEGLERSVRDTVTTKNLLAITEGAYGEVQKILQDMKNLTLHAANSGITSPEQVAEDQARMDESLQAIDRILGATGMAGQKVLGNITPRDLNNAAKNAAKPAPEGKDNAAGTNTAGNGTAGSTATGSGTAGNSTAGNSIAGNSIAGNSAAGNGGAAEVLPGAPEGGAMTEGGLASRLTLGDGAASLSPEGGLLSQLSKKDREMLDLSKKLIDMGSTAGLGKIDLSELGWEGQASLHDLYSGGLASLEKDPVAAMRIIEQASKDTAAARAAIGAQRNSLDSLEDVGRDNLEQLTKMESGIRDVDMAEEITQFSKNKILSEVGAQLLGAANDQWRNIESLITMDAGKR